MRFSWIGRNRRKDGLFARFITLEGDRKPLRALLNRLGNLIRFRDNSKETLEALLQEAEFHVLIASPEEEVHLDPVPLLEPSPRFRSLDAHVVLRSPDFDLDFLGFRDLHLRFNLLVLLVLLVFEFAIIRDLADRRLRKGGDLDEVEPGFVGFLERLVDLKDAIVFGVRADDAHLGHADALVHAHTRLVLLSGVFGEAHLT